MKRKSIHFGHKIMGVYAIQNMVTDKVYIGSSVDIRKRWSHHIKELNKGVHSNSRLQNSWNCYGEENFSFSVMELVEDRNSLFEREQYWIDQLDACNKEIGFNIAEIAGCPPMTEESRKKQSESLKNNTEFMKRTSEFLKEKHKDKEFERKLDYGRRHSEKVKEQLIKLNASPEHKKQVQDLLNALHSDKNNMKRVSEMYKDNLKKDSWRASHGMRKILQIDDCNNVVAIHDSLRDLQKLGFSRYSIARICKQNSCELHRGFRWQYAT